MTATEELRRLLDERGVEHLDGIIMTYTDDADYMPSASNTFDVTLYNLTPEQAIDATLGRGTTTRTGKHRTKYGRRIPVCERCGYGIGDMRWNYCPSCGAEVVDE